MTDYQSVSVVNGGNAIRLENERGNGLTVYRCKNGGVEVRVVIGGCSMGCELNAVQARALVGQINSWMMLDGVAR